LFEKQPAVILDMIEVQDSRASPAEELSQLSLSFNERQRSQVLPVQVKQIKSDVFTGTKTDVAIFGK
jgi:hypothetical protein